MKRTICETPDNFSQNGAPALGVFRRPFREINTGYSDIFRGPVGAVRRLRMKEWIGFGVTHPDLYCALMIIDVQTSCFNCVYASDRKTGEFFEWGRPTFNKKHYRLAETVWNDRSFVDLPGFHLEYRHNLDAGRHHIIARVTGRGGDPDLTADLILHQDMDRLPPLVAVVPVRQNFFMYTHKTFMPVEGLIRLGDTEYAFDPARDIANMDEHRAAYPFRAKWRWGALGGRNKKGDFIGFNAVENINFLDIDNHNENALWFGDTLEPIGPVQFELDPADPLAPWQIHDAEGRVDLEFIPDGGKKEHRDYFLINIDYFQHYGRFRGRLKDSAGKKRPVDDIYGVVERGDGFF